MRSWSRPCSNTCKRTSSLHPAVTALRTQLEQAGRDYFCDTSLPAPLAAVRFIGPFQGEDVVWQLNLTTLAQARRHAPAPCPFIEIAAGEAGVHAITVGLELPHIDEPAIRKSIIMVRKYKRLAVGRLEFCAGGAGI